MNFRPDPKKQSAACGNSVSWTHSDGMTDEDGHAVAIVHSQWANRLAKQRDAVLQLHGLDLATVEIVPLCRECRKVYPCPTALASL